MNNTAKTVLVSLAAGVSVVAGVVSAQPTPMTYDEYKAYVKVIDYEIKHNKDLFKNIGKTNSKNILDKIESEAKRRKPKAGEGFETEFELKDITEYETARNNLFQKRKESK